MKRKKNVIIMLGLIAVLLGFYLGIRYEYRRAEGLRFVKRLGHGINIGNSLDVNNLQERGSEPTPADYETYWGNPQCTPELFEAIADSGLRSVRIPVCWGEHLLEDDRIDPVWIARVETVVDDALAAGLYVILDLHHEAWLIPEETREPQVTRRLCSIWEQIAHTFADRDEHLLFESMNEPRLVGTEHEWDEGTKEARAVVNRLNAAFVETVRSCGGYNETRWLLLPAYCSVGKKAALEALILPRDNRLIVAVHAYYPYRFTLDEDGTRDWSREESRHTKELDALMEDLDQLFLSRKIPVVISEYGCRDKQNPRQRLDWLDYYLSKASQLGIACFWWDNGSDSQIIDRSLCQWTQRELLDCMLHYQPKALDPANP